MPGVLADKSTCPVTGFITNAAGALNTPALAGKTKVGKGSTSPGQYGPAYVKVAEGEAITFIVAVVSEEHVPLVVKVMI